MKIQKQVIAVIEATGNHSHLAGLQRACHGDFTDKMTDYKGPPKDFKEKT